MMFDRRSSARIRYSTMVMCWRVGVPTALLIIASCGVRAQHLPVGGHALRGGITVVSENAQSLRIDQREAGGEIDWASFNIAEHHCVRVQQPSADAVLLNRVTGQTPSVLAGTLEENGTVLLVNPNGIEITPTSVIRSAGFGASTLDLRHDDVEDLFEQGNVAKLDDNLHRFLEKLRGPVLAPSRRAAASDAGIAHHGKMLLHPHGTAVLLAASVSSTGTIVAPSGRIALVAINRPIPQSDGGAMLNHGDDRLAAAVRMGGSVQAQSSALRRGQIVVSAEGRRVSIGGELDTSAPAGAWERLVANETPIANQVADANKAIVDDRVEGGLVSITAAQIDVSGARINANGSGYGGEISLTTGAANEAEARIAVGHGTQLFANAESGRGEEGDVVTRGGGRGGRVTLASSGALVFNAQVHAKGRIPLAVSLADRLHHAASSSDDAALRRCSGGRISFASCGEMKLRGEIDASPTGVYPDGVISVTTTSVHIAPWGGNDTGPAQTGNVMDNTTLSNTLQRSTVAIVSPGQSSGERDATIHVDGPVDWSSSNGLILHADSSIRVHAPMRATGFGASVHLSSLPRRAYMFDGGSLTLLGEMSMLSIDGLPYSMIRNAAQLREHLAASDGGLHALAESIDLSSAAFQPIMNRPGKHFSHFEGLGNTLSNLRIEAPTMSRVGLFTRLGNEALVSNLVLADADVRGACEVGVIAGVMRGTSRLEGVRLANAMVRNTPWAVVGEEASERVGYHSAGGVVGTMLDSSAIFGAAGSVDVVGHGNTGGIAGTMMGSSSLSTSKMRGTVVASEPSGGVVGAMADHARISHVDWHGAVQGVPGHPDALGPHGGIAGLQTGGLIEHANADGSVAGILNVGGVVGAVIRTGKVSHCAARNTVSGKRHVGGLVGRVSGTAALSSNHVLSSVVGERDVGSLVGFFEAGVLADNLTHGVVTQFGRPLGAVIGRRGLASGARYLPGSGLRDSLISLLDLGDRGEHGGPGDLSPFGNVAAGFALTGEKDL